MNWSRRLVKSLTYRVLSIVVQLVVVGKFIGFQWTWFVLGLNGLLILTYYVHELVWDALTHDVKWTVRSPNRGLLPTKLRALMSLLRPATLLPAAVVGLAGARIVGLSWADSFLFGVVLVLMQGGGQALNQSNRREIELDRVNHKDYRPTVSGVVTVSEAKGVAYACLIAGVGVAFAMGIWWLGLFMASTAVLYTQEPFYLKRFFPVNLLVQAAGRGFLPIFTLGWLAGRDTLPLAVFFFVWVFALQSTKDFGDADGDRQFGIKTLPVLLGKSRAKPVMLGITVLDYAFALATGMWFLLVIAPLDVSAILTCEKDWKVVENSLGWALYYASLGIGTVVGLAL